MESVEALAPPRLGLGRLSYRSLQWILLLLLVVHGAEELLVLSQFRPELEAIQLAHPGVLRPLPEISQVLPFLFVLLVVAGIPIALPVGPKGARVRDTIVAAVAVGFFINALFQHLPSTLRTGSYTPGVLSAVLLAMPFSVYFVVRSLRERRVSPLGLAVAVAIAGAFLFVGLKLVARAVGLT
jgi:hypothetical protein